MTSLMVLPCYEKDGLALAQKIVTKYHYLHTPVDPRCRPMAYRIELDGQWMGCLIFGRPEATRCYRGKLTYGSFDEVKSGRVKFDRWEILNLARVWLDPNIQRGGEMYIHHAASAVIKDALHKVGFDYLFYAPPVDCNFPYQIRCVLSYCDTNKHNGWIYKASRFHLARTNERGIQTYMHVVDPLDRQEDDFIKHWSDINKRSKRIRAERVSRGAQMSMEVMT